MNYYIEEAAKNKGWTVETIRREKPYIIKYTKEDLTFFSNNFQSIDVNHSTMHLADNKVLTYLMLEQYNLPTIPCETLDTTKNKPKGKVILKPTYGKLSQGLMIAENEKEYAKAIKKINNSNTEYCISPHFPHTVELRFIVFCGEVQFYHLKSFNPENPLRPKIKTLPKNFIKRIRKMKEIAISATKILNYNYLSVDFLINDKDFKILEVNSNSNLVSYEKLGKKNFNRNVVLLEKMFDLKEKLMKVN